ncbi:hypothetical protein RHMOL_Rhmol05G0156300 [Rhododendron molle]|uniref:Uncharacterized protein n=1 Tax=Rhododendron molle TaxID=49168 RepID=A0ACC0NQL4_RHOML|nr:hypothetical protein RHMOL_Rhmol05G0156300 [Rhododendron molle]
MEYKEPKRVKLRKTQFKSHTNQSRCEDKDRHLIGGRQTRREDKSTWANIIADQSNISDTGGIDSPESAAAVAADVIPISPLPEHLISEELPPPPLTTMDHGAHPMTTGDHHNPTPELPHLRRPTPPPISENPTVVTPITKMMSPDSVPSAMPPNSECVEEEEVWSGDCEDKQEVWSGDRENEQEPNGKWRLNRIALVHNHDQSPGKVRYLRSNRVLDEQVKRRLKLNDKAGINLNQTYTSLQIEAGGPGKLPYMQKDCRNYVDKVRRSPLVEGDAQAMHNYFMKMKADNSDFFFAMDLDDEGRLRNVFWADARSRAACKEFGDVVTFDTTYLANRHDMPFAPFVGVNHHGQSILLGCGLISHEDTKSFSWYFKLGRHACGVVLRKQLLPTNVWP